MAVTWDTLTYDNNGYSGLVSDDFLKAVNDLGEQRKLFFTGTNELLKTFQQLNLNDSEFSDTGIVPKYMSMFDNIITDYNMSGDVGGAYNDLMTLTRKMYSSPDLIGRVRANASYEDFKKRVNDNKTLSQDYKNWLLEISPYNYVDGPEDENGNPTFGDTWKPTREPVDNIPMSEIYEKACKYVSSESGGYIGAYFLNAAGNPTRKYNDSEDKWLYKATDTGTYERISRDDMLKAIHTTIASDPAMSASLHQDFDYNIYRYNKEVAKQQQNSYSLTEPVVQKGITDENGRVINDFNAYLENIVDPVASLASYTNVKPNFNSNGTIKAKTSNKDAVKTLPTGSVKITGPDGNKYYMSKNDNGETVYYKYNNDKKNFIIVSDPTNKQSSTDKNSGKEQSSTDKKSVQEQSSTNKKSVQEQSSTNNKSKYTDRYGGTIRHIAALGTETFDETNDESEDLVSHIENRFMNGPVESEDAWDRNAGIMNVGNTSINISTWDALDNTKQSSENQIMQFLNEFEPEIAKKCFNVYGFINLLSEHGKTLTDFFSRAADLYHGQYVYDYPEYQTGPIFADKVDYNDHALFALQTAIDVYERTDSTMNKYLNDNSDQYINLSFFRPTGLERFRTEINNPTVADALNFSKCAERQIYDGDDQFTKELVNEINNVFTKDAMREYYLTVGGNVWKHYLAQNNWDSDKDCPIDTKMNADGSHTLHLDNKCANLVPKLMYQLDIADDACEGRNPWNWLKKHNQDGYYDDDCYAVTGGKSTVINDVNPELSYSYKLPYSHEPRSRTNSKHALQRLGNMYKSYMNLVEQAKNKIGNSSYSFLQNWASGCACEGSFYATCFPNVRTSSDNRSEVDKRDELFYKNLLPVTDFSQGYMEVYNDAGVAEKVYDAQKYDEIIHVALANNCLKSSFCPLYTYADTDGKLRKGYLFSITVPDYDEKSSYAYLSGKKKDDLKVPDILKPYVGNVLRIFTSGAIDEGYNVALGADPVTRTDQQYNLLNSMDMSFIPNIGYAQGIGNTRFDINKNAKEPKDKYSTRIFNDDFQFDDDDAKNLSELLFECESLKGYYYSNFVTTGSDIDKYIEHLSGKIYDILLNAKIRQNDDRYITNDMESREDFMRRLRDKIKVRIQSYVYYNHNYKPSSYVDADEELIRNTNDNKNIVIKSGYLK